MLRHYTCIHPRPSVHLHSTKSSKPKLIIRLTGLLKPITHFAYQHAHSARKTKLTIREKSQQQDLRQSRGRLQLIVCELHEYQRLPFLYITMLV